MTLSTDVLYMNKTINSVLSIAKKFSDVQFESRVEYGDGFGVVLLFNSLVVYVLMAL